jgi:C1A family cysteine protease/V8-like Glu-specific endopeptidase
MPTIDAPPTKFGLVSVESQDIASSSTGIIPAGAAIHHTESNVDIVPQTVIGSDDRTRVSLSTVQTFPRNTIGFVLISFSIDEWYRGTGFLVSPHTILTNAHNVYDEDMGGYVQSLEFFPAQYQSTEGGQVTLPYGSRDAVDVKTNQQYIDAWDPDVYTLEMVSHDYAAAFIEEPFSDITTYMPLLFDYTPAIGSSIHTAGYPKEVKGENDSLAQWYVSGGVVDLDARVLAHDADVTGGQSGSPTWIEDAGTGSPRAIAFVSFSSTEYNGGPRLVSTNQDLIEEWMQWTPYCAVSAPDMPSGSSSGITGTSYTYATGDSSSDEAHSIEYRFDWGDGSYSSWSSSTSASQSWDLTGTYDVRAQARCASETLSESTWSSPLTVTVAEPPAPEIDASPSSFTFSLPMGGTDQDTLTISNTGDGALTYSITVRETASGSALEGVELPDDGVVSTRIDAVSMPQAAPLNLAFLDCMDNDYMDNPSGYSFGYIPPPFDLSHLKDHPLNTIVAADALPASYDWRDYGKVTPVSNQGQCGTCWIFGTLSALESAVLIGEDVEYDFSEQSVALCVDRSWVYLYAADSGGPCDPGGWGTTAADVLIKRGAVLESCNPYDTSGLRCEDNCGCDSCLPVMVVDGFRMVTDSQSDTDLIKQAIYAHGPVTVAYHHDWDHESDDLTYGRIHDYADAPSANHMVSIVGWNDDVPRPDSGGTGAWLIKNSWDTDWGNDGFFWLAYDSSAICHVLSLSYADYNPDRHLLFWDEAGQTTSGGWVSQDSAWMANSFTTPRNGHLTDVSFYTTSNNAEYQAYIYLDGDPSDGLENLVAYQSGACEELGYYTVPLDWPVPVTQDDEFTIAVKMTTPGYYYPIPIEMTSTGYVEPPIQPRVSFVRLTGGDPWLDVADRGWNVCLRAVLQEGELWLSVHPTSGNIPPDDSEELTISVDASSLPAGSYQAEIVITSNDPDNSEIIVPVSLTVSPPPVVTTDAATGVSEEAATLNGTLVDDGDEACDVWFVYGTLSGGPYPYSTPPQSNVRANEDFSCGVTGLLPGTVYYYRAQASNSAGPSYGNEVSFTTPPYAPSDFAAVADSPYQVSLSWTADNSSTSTYIRMQQGSSWDEGAPSEILYEGDGESFTHGPLHPGTTYQYRAWSWVLDAGGNPVRSAGFASDEASTPEGDPLTTFPLPLHAGWNMVSVPLDLVGFDEPGQVFPDAAAIYEWDADEKQYDSPAIIVPGHGYWVAMAVADPGFTVEGVLLLPENQQLSLSGGWNLIGSMWHPTDVPVTDLDATPSAPDPLRRDDLYHWNGTSYDNPTVIEPGKAYWLAATEPCTITVTPP